MSVWRVALAIAAKDLRIERRSRTALMTATLFAVMVQLIMVFAHDTGASPLASLAPSVLWIMLSLASLLTLNRSFLLEREHRALEGILLAPVSRVALFWGKWLANLAFVMMMTVVAFPLWVLFFNISLDTALLSIALLTVLAAAGLTAVGTVFAAMAVRTRHAELLLPVLMLPFTIPPVYFAAAATVRLLQARPFGEVAPLFRMLALFDLAFFLTATMLFPMVVDE